MKYYISTPTPKISEAAQKVAFAKGYSWSFYPYDSPKYTTSDRLYLCHNFLLSYGYEADGEMKGFEKISLEELILVTVPVKLEIGDKTFVIDKEEKLIRIMGVGASCEFDDFLLLLSKLQEIEKLTLGERKDKVEFGAFSLKVGCQVFSRDEVVAIAAIILER